MASEFYLVLPSNSSMVTHPNNTLAQYITNLPRRISLSGVWECGLTEIHYPHDWYNVRNARLTVEHDGNVETDVCFEDGEYSKNPFNAKNNAINFLAVYADGRQVPAKPLRPNFETGSYIRSYVNLFSATGKQSQDEGNGLSRDDFGQGYTFFGFDLTPDGCEGGCFHLTRKCNIRIEMHFATALEHTVNVFVYGEFEAVLEIDKGLNIIYNY